MSFDLFFPARKLKQSVTGHRISPALLCMVFLPQTLSPILSSQQPLRHTADRARHEVLDLTLQTGSVFPNQTRKKGAPLIRDYNGKSSGMFFDGASCLMIPGNPKLKFDQGDRVTLEAWVAPLEMANDQQVYILGKGRTHNRGFSRENQNYALRLRGINDRARISFLFRSRNPKSGQEQFHRWNSEAGFSADGSWHHVVLEYEFGKPENIAAYLDGKKSPGSWDMGGPTTDPPVVDEDELWVGSSMAGAPSASFVGWMRGIRIYRGDPGIQWRNHARHPPVPLPSIRLDHSVLDPGKVLVEIIEKVPVSPPPLRNPLSPNEAYLVDHFALDGLPRKYIRPGVISDRSTAFLVRVRTRLAINPGQHEFLLRAKSATAFLLNDRVIASLPMMKKNSSGHEPVPELKEYSDATLYPPPPGHREITISANVEVPNPVLTVETLVGGKGLRTELGELLLGMRRSGESSFRIVSHQKPARSMTYQDWYAVSQKYRRQIRLIEKRKRIELAKLDAAKWESRHRDARLAALKRMPDLRRLSIDRLVEDIHRREKIAPAGPCDDFAFLRRVYLDTLGIPPSAREVLQFANDRDPAKRRKIIDRLLNDDRYAGHWVSYWQDVLAENPGILKPKLNNTGPFRFWIHESLLDNKPMDRFVTELIEMKGSPNEGGPAGFAQATQNDVPFAAKANVLCRAFLGIDLTCARCHDSPSNDFRQEDLFQLAAMLKEKPIVVPRTSSVPGADKTNAIRVTLQPGTRVQPGWPFEAELKVSPSSTTHSRSQFAELITRPDNDRFSRVVANRIWTRVMGKGLMDSADDFLLGQPTHPRLLDFLANSFQASGYNAKQLLRQILNSKTYQQNSSGNSRLTKHYAAHSVRRMTAEQLVDSLFAISGKPMAVGQISFDPEGRRTSATFLNLGKPERAWELVSLANERDRPALALPRAQAIVDLLTAYGWRESRPNPISQRDESVTLVQPLVLANGDASHRITQLSDDSAITDLALQATGLDDCITRTYLQILSRPPSNEESQITRELLSRGFDSRKNLAAPRNPPYSQQFRNAVSWSNHLHPNATRIKLEIEQAVRLGDKPTARLDPDWRERMEDLVWALINSPEFTLVQ
ncbi:MAG: DUF1553 domain-containing protein [Planctomycetota bacterium]|nr:DUF1553 domain-containing protein [Planctomycetota bacterium]